LSFNTNFYETSFENIIIIKILGEPLASFIYNVSETNFIKSLY